MLLLPLSLVQSPAKDAVAQVGSTATTPFSTQLLPVPSHAGALLCETLGPEEVLCRVLPQVRH